MLFGGLDSMFAQPVYFYYGEAKHTRIASEKTIRCREDGVEDEGAK